MKKKYLIVILTVIFLTALFSSCQPTEVPAEPDPNNGSQNENPIEALTYEEFFSVEREFNIWREYEDDRSYIVLENALHMSIGMNQEKKLIYNATAVTFPARNADALFCVSDGLDLIMLTLDGEHIKTLYHSESGATLSQLFCDGDVLFFKDGDTVCRMYLPTEQVDLIVVLDSVAENMNPEMGIIFTPLSTTDIEWFGSDKDKDPNIEGSQISYAYSALTDKNYLIVGRYYFIGEPGENLLQYFQSQYLAERAEDLIAIGLDPHEISTCRFPEDDIVPPDYDPFDEEAAAALRARIRELEEKLLNQNE